MTDLTYPFLREWYERSKIHMQPATIEWVMAKAKAVSGGKAYPANQPLSDDEVTEGVSDMALYRRVYNAVVPWAGKALAEKVAKGAMPKQRDAVSVPYREDPVIEETMTNEDTEGLTEDVGALFLWNWVKPARLQEIYGENMEKVPDYVPQGKRRAWAAMFDALKRKGMEEDKIFAVVNAKYVKRESYPSPHLGRPGEVGGSRPRGEGIEADYPELGISGKTIGQDMWQITGFVDVKKFRTHSWSILVYPDGSIYGGSSDETHHAKLASAANRKLDDAVHLRYLRTFPPRFRADTQYTPEAGRAALRADATDEDRAIDQVLAATKLLAKKGLPKELPIDILMGNGRGRFETTISEAMLLGNMGLKRLMEQNGEGKK